MKHLIKLLLFTATLAACNSKEKSFDASGNFEADEVIVPAQQAGIILRFDVDEGKNLQKNEIVGQIDVAIQQLQREQNTETVKAIRQKTVTPNAQIEVARSQLAAQQTQLNNLQTERGRISNLVKADAAPGKQLDDIDYQVMQLQKQMQVTREQINLYSSNANTQNRGILSETGPLEKSTAQIELQISRGEIVNPLQGTVLTKYAMPGEMATIGKPLYKIASLDTINLKAYVTGDQLPAIRLGDSVTVRIDNGDKTFKNYPGRISWIAGKSEFTPKTIQTKNERANLVYAIKVPVKNDGFIKIGMYGEVIFNK